MTQSRVTQLGIEAPVIPTPGSRVTQLGIEAVTNPTPRSRVTQLAAEVLVSNRPLSRITQLAIEALVPNATAVDQGGATGQLWPRGGGPVPGGANSATQLQGRAVSASAPTPGQGLVWNGAAWAPSTPAADAVSIRGVGVAVTAPTNGQSLIYNSSSGLYEPGSSGGATYTLFDPYKRPASPNALDDEYDGLSVASYANVNIASLTNAPVIVNGRLLIDTTGLPLNTIAAKMLALPAGDFSIVTECVMQDSALDFCTGGLYFANGATAGAGSQFVIGMQSNSGFKLRNIDTASNFGAYTANLGTPRRVWTHRMFLRLRRSGTTYVAGHSFDCETWFNETIAPAFTPTFYGVGTSKQSNNVNYEISFGFTRYAASATATTIYGGTRTVSGS